jgi:hypothetical protein
MHRRFSFLTVLGCAAFTLMAGCATTSQQNPPDNGPPPATPGKTEPVTTSPEPTPSTSSSPWQRARVGDLAVYSFSANQAPGPGAPSSLISGRMTLEVVAVQQPWVWLKVSFADEAGKALANARLAQELILPMHMEASRPLEVPREGTESVEQPSAAGRTWEARRYIRDNRPADGPLENRLYAMRPGPLYLTNGLLDASTTLSGFGASGGSQLTLVEVRQGAEGATAAAPTLERPLGSGAFYDIQINMPGNNGVHRACFSAERGYVLRTQGPAPAAGGPACPSFAEADVVPLEEHLLGLISEAVSSASWPPPTAASATRGTFSVAGRSVPALTAETPESEGSVRKVRYETFAAAPWDASLAGLPLEARFRALTEGVDRLGAKGKREPEAFTKLVGWGTWLGSAK